MANQKHLEILKQGVEVWNEWRDEHSDILPDFTDANALQLMGFPVQSICNPSKLTLQSSPGAELKGTISCQQLNSGGPTKEQPITISNGQFDVFSMKSSVG